MEPVQDPPADPPFVLRAGLSPAEAAARLRRFGPNETGENRRRGWTDALKAVGSEPMFLLLLGAAAVYLAVGDLGEGLLLGFFALVSVGLVVLQEYRGERALDALRALAVRHVQVIRGGASLRIPSVEVVPGDLIVLSEGERVAADAVLREASAVQVDESLLTGEAMPVRKLASSEPPREAVPGGEDSPFVFAGTLAVGGHGIAEVIATGHATQMGRIGASLASIDTRGTPLQRQLARLVRQFGWVAIALSAMLVLGYGLLRGQWLQGLLSALAFAMGMLPEEIPMVLTVFVGLAAWRMARMNVLARRPAVVEALGAATVLCVDKTGTLTHNRQQLRRLATAEVDLELTAGEPLPESVHVLLEYAVMASRRGSVDPLDLAVLRRADRSLQQTEHLHPQWLLQQEYPITPELLAMSQAWTRPDGGHEIAAKGAAEAVADLCHLDAQRRQPWLQRADALAQQGLRVLAVARGSCAAGTLAREQHDYDFEPLGLLGFEDPLRADVPAAVRQAHEAGIAVAMMTGDHVLTALAIAREAGIATEAGALTGEQLEAMDDAALRAAVQRVRVFARVMPQQKLRLVQAFQANGETVAMTGDGVNDAPALKAAHIGIAMGVRGTDVAREAAGLVLLEEDFARIVAGVRTGRRTFDNLRRAMTYIVAIHVPIAGLALLPVLFGLPPLLLPAHVVLTQMVVDPACSFAFEGLPEAPGLMQRPPRSAREALLGRATVWRGVAQGGVLLLMLLLVYFFALRAGSVEQARTLAVVALTAGNLTLVAVHSGEAGRPAWNTTLLVVTVLAFAALAVGIVWPAARALLGFALTPWRELAAAAAGACALVVITSLASTRRR
jgi:P-type Ca2+ transporter type 2C